MIKDFAVGLFSYVAAFRYLFRLRLWRWLLVPGLLSIALILVLLTLAFSGISVLVNDGIIPILPPFLVDLGMALILQILINILAVLGVLFLYKHVILIIAAPFLGIIATKVFRDLNPHSPSDDTTFKEELKLLWRGLRVNLTLALRSLIWVFGLFFVSFVPIIGSVIFTAGSFLSQAYFAGAGLMDLGFEKYRLNTQESFNYLEKRPAAVLGVGSGFVLILFIPFLGWFLAPALGAIAGTITIIRIKESQK